MRNTRGSRRIASRCASRRASRYVVAVGRRRRCGRCLAAVGGGSRWPSAAHACAPVAGLGAGDEAREVLDRLEGRRVGGSDRRGDLLADLPLPLLDVGGRSPGPAARAARSAQGSGRLASTARSRPCRGSGRGRTSSGRGTGRSAAPGSTGRPLSRTLGERPRSSPPAPAATSIPSTAQDDHAVGRGARGEVGLRRARGPAPCPWRSGCSRSRTAPAGATARPGWRSRGTPPRRTPRRRRGTR